MTTRIESAAAALEEMVNDAPTTSNGNELPTSKHLSELALAYLQARRDTTAAKREAAKVQEIEDRLEAELIEQMRQQGVKSLKLDAQPKTITFVSKITCYYRMPPEADEQGKALVMKWLARCGGKSLIKPSVAWQSFSAWCRERVEDGRTIHSSVQVVEKKGISVTGADA